MRDAADEKSSPPMRPAKVVALVAVLIVVVSAIAVVAPFVFEASIPPPLFTETDLPTLPPPSQNGYVLLRVRPIRSPSTPPTMLALLEKTRHHDANALFAAEAARHTELVSWLASGTNPATMRDYRAAISKPRFVDTCPSPTTPFVACPSTTARYAHQVVLGEALLRAASSDWSRAFELVADLARSSRELALTGRSFISQALGFVMLDSAARMATRFAERYRSLPEADRAPLDDAAKRAIRRLVSAGPVDASGATLHYAVVTDYLSLRHHVEHARDTLRPIERMQLDRGRTIAILDALTREGDAFVTGRSSTPPADPPDGFALYNNTGRRLLQMMGTPWARMKTSHDNHRSHALPELRTAIGALRPLM